MKSLLLTAVSCVLFSVCYGSFCSSPVTKKVSCRVKNGTETYTKMVPRLCTRKWSSSTQGGNSAPVNCGTEARIKIRPKFVTTYKSVTEMQYRCCPGFSGSNCDMECFNCTMLDRMERRLRSVEDILRSVEDDDSGSSNSTTSRDRWLNRRQIRPGRPDKSHVHGVSLPGSRLAKTSRTTSGVARRPFSGYHDIRGSRTYERERIPTTTSRSSRNETGGSHGPLTGRRCSCPPGADGAPGPAGQPGLTGIPGLPGRDGVDGLPGASGLQGPPGAAGSTGEAGKEGLPGLPGIPGPGGQRGSPGIPGLNGEAGSAGEPGKTGESGIDGAPGLPGQNGEQGQPGFDGLPGTAGPVGPMGPPGLPGPPGPPGPSGSTGSSKTIRRDKAASGYLREGSGDPLFQDDEDDEVNGLAGAPGPSGPAGLQGPAGEKGEQGLPGPPGPKGDGGYGGNDKLVLESDFTDTVLQLHHFIEELRGQIVQLQKRVTFLEGGAGVVGGSILPNAAYPAVIAQLMTGNSAASTEAAAPAQTEATTTTTTTTTTTAAPTDPPPLIVTPPPDYENLHLPYSNSDADDDEEETVPALPYTTTTTTPSSLDGKNKEYDEEDEGDEDEDYDADNDVFGPQDSGSGKKSGTAVSAEYDDQEEDDEDEDYDNYDYEGDADY